MSLARSLFYAWEKRLAFKDDPERRVLDFQWGAEFLPSFGSWHPPEITPSESEARALLHDHAERALESSEDLCLLFIHPRAPNLIGLRSAGTMPA